MGRTQGHGQQFATLREADCRRIVAADAGDGREAADDGEPTLRFDGSVVVIAQKRDEELAPLALRPHPHEFALYYDA